MKPTSAERIERSQRILGVLREAGRRPRFVFDDGGQHVWQYIRVQND
jgi:hypothetical protein